MDQCLVRHFTGIGANDGFNNPIVTYGDPYQSVCGYAPGATSEAPTNDGTVLLDGKLRLPVDIPIQSLDRIDLTHLKGEALESPLKFEVVGLPALGPSGYLVGIRKITNE